MSLRVYVNSNTNKLENGLLLISRADARTKLRRCECTKIYSRRSISRSLYAYDTRIAPLLSKLYNEIQLNSV